MKISEYINSEKEKMKDKSFKERLAYFWDYYKWYVLIGVVALFLVGQTVSSALNQKDIALSGILIDGIPPAEDIGIIQSFYDANGIDAEKEEILLSTGISLDSSLPDVVTTSYQMIHARIGAGDTDFLMGYEYAITQCAYDTSHMFADLRDVFPAETLSQWEAYIYYVDGSVWEQIKNSPKENIPLPDPHKPEEMADPIPVAIDVSGCIEFTSLYYAPDRAVYIAVVTNSPRKELTARFIEHLLS